MPYIGGIDVPEQIGKTTLAEAEEKYKPQVEEAVKESDERAEAETKRRNLKSLLPATDIQIAGQTFSPAKYIKDNYNGVVTGITDDNRLEFTGMDKEGNETKKVFDPIGFLKSQKHLDKHVDKESYDKTISNTRSSIKLDDARMKEQDLYQLELRGQDIRKKHEADYDVKLQEHDTRVASAKEEIKKYKDGRDPEQQRIREELMKVIVSDAPEYKTAPRLAFEKTLEDKEKLSMWHKIGTKYDALQKATKWGDLIDWSFQEYGGTDAETESGRYDILGGVSEATQNLVLARETIGGEQRAILENIEAKIIRKEQLSDQEAIMYYTQPDAWDQVLGLGKMVTKEPGQLYGMLTKGIAKDLPAMALAGAGSAALVSRLGLGAKGAVRAEMMLDLVADVSLESAYSGEIGAPEVLSGAIGGGVTALGRKAVSGLRGTPQEVIEKAKEIKQNVDQRVADKMKGKGVEADENVPTPSPETTVPKESRDNIIKEVYGENKKTTPSEQVNQQVQQQQELKQAREEAVTEEFAEQIGKEQEFLKKKMDDQELVVAAESGQKKLDPMEWERVQELENFDMPYAEYELQFEGKAKAKKIQQEYQSNKIAEQTLKQTDVPQDVIDSKLGTGEPATTAKAEAPKKAEVKKPEPVKKVSEKAVKKTDDKAEAKPKTPIEEIREKYPELQRKMAKTLRDDMQEKIRAEVNDRWPKEAKTIEREIGLPDTDSPYFKKQQKVPTKKALGRQFTQDELDKVNVDLDEGTASKLSTDQGVIEFSRTADGKLQMVDEKDFKYDVLPSGKLKHLDGETKAKISKAEDQSTIGDVIRSAVKAGGMKVKENDLLGSLQQTAKYGRSSMTKALDDLDTSLMEKFPKEFDSNKETGLEFIERRFGDDLDQKLFDTEKQRIDVKKAETTPHIMNALEEGSGESYAGKSMTAEKQLGNQKSKTVTLMGQKYKLTKEGDSVYLTGDDISKQDVTGKKIQFDDKKAYKAFQTQQKSMVKTNEVTKELPNNSPVNEKEAVSVSEANTKDRLTTDELKGAPKKSTDLEHKIADQMDELDQELAGASQDIDALLGAQKSLKKDLKKATGASAREIEDVLNFIEDDIAAYQQMVGFNKVENKIKSDEFLDNIKKPISPALMGAVGLLTYGSTFLGDEDDDSAQAGLDDNTSRGLILAATAGLLWRMNRKGSFSAIRAINNSPIGNIWKKTKTRVRDMKGGTDIVHAIEVLKNDATVKTAKAQYEYFDAVKNLTDEQKSELGLALAGKQKAPSKAVKDAEKRVRKLMVRAFMQGDEVGFQWSQQFDDAVEKAIWDVSNTQGKVHPRDLAKQLEFLENAGLNAEQIDATAAKLSKIVQGRVNNYLPRVLEFDKIREMQLQGVDGELWQLNKKHLMESVKIPDKFTGKLRTIGGAEADIILKTYYSKSSQQNGFDVQGVIDEAVFKKKLEKQFKSEYNRDLKDDEINALISNVVSRFTNRISGNLKYGRYAPELEPTMYKNNTDEILPSYFKNAYNAIEQRRWLGNGEDMNLDKLEKFYETIEDPSERLGIQSMVEKGLADEKFESLFAGKLSKKNQEKIKYASNVMRTAETFKYLFWSFKTPLNNLLYAGNTIASTGLFTSLKGWMKAATKHSRQEAEAAGAISNKTMDQIMDLQKFKTTWKPERIKKIEGWLEKTNSKVSKDGAVRKTMNVGKWLAGGGPFKATEKFLRVAAFEAGRSSADKLLKQVIDQGNTRSAKRLITIIGEPEYNRAVANGFLEPDARDAVGLAYSKKLAGAVGILDLPPWMNTPEGAVLAQFKKTAYAQTDMFMDDIIKPARNDISQSITAATDIFRKNKKYERLTKYDADAKLQSLGHEMWARTDSYRKFIAVAGAVGLTAKASTKLGELFWSEHFKEKKAQISESGTMLEQALLAVWQINALGLLGDVGKSFDSTLPQGVPGAGTLIAPSIADMWDLGSAVMSDVGSVMFDAGMINNPTENKGFAGNVREQGKKQISLIRDLDNLKGNYGSGRTEFFNPERE